MGLTSVKVAELVSMLRLRYLARPCASWQGNGKRSTHASAAGQVYGTAEADGKKKPEPTTALPPTMQVPIASQPCAFYICGSSRFRVGEFHSFGSVQVSPMDEAKNLPAGMGSDGVGDAGDKKWSRQRRSRGTNRATLTERGRQQHSQ